MQLPSRQDAIAAGLTKYQGDSCLRGHAGVRYVGNKACIDCTVDYGKAWKAANAEKERDRRKEWKRQNRDLVLAEKRRYQERHREEIRARGRKYYHLDPYGAVARRAARDKQAAAGRIEARRLARQEKTRERRRPSPEYNRRRYQIARMTRLSELQEYWRLKSKIRRARKRGAEIKATTTDIRLLREMQGGACAYCGKKGGLHLDHKYPLALGGQHTFSNLQFLCAWHNMSKHTIPDAEYRKAHGIPRTTQWDSLL